MRNKFPLLSSLKQSYPELMPFYSQSWVCAGITAYYSQQNQFDILEFDNYDLTDEIFFVNDWTGKIIEGIHAYGNVFEGHADYWCNPMLTKEIKNSIIITGHEHLRNFDNNVTTIGFDYWDINTHTEYSYPGFYYEINRSSVSTAMYDIVIPVGALKKYRIEFLNQLNELRGKLSIVTDDRQTVLNTDLRFKKLGIEVYLNKFNIPDYVSYTSYPSFYNTNASRSIDHLPHKKMHSIARVNVVLETTTYSIEQPYLTEKTFKILAQHRPFVILGDTHVLQKLKQEGYLTFAKFCDESYDTETDLHKRTIKVIIAIKQLVEACKQHPKEIDSICQHNQRTFFNASQRHTDKLAKFGKLFLDLTEHRKPIA
jgi:hypothetical protein